MVFSDDFNRPDGALGSDWLLISGGVIISGGRAIATQQSPGIHNIARVVHPQTDHHQVEADVVGTDLNSPAGLFLRMSSAATQGDVTGYAVFYQPTQGGWVFERWIGGGGALGNFTYLTGLVQLVTPSTTGRLKAEIAGNIVRAYWNGVLAAYASDPSPVLTGEYVGLFSGHQNVTWDNLNTADVPDPEASVVPLLRRRQVGV